ncbi:CBM96 family carbohydrate-binding protein [Streptomyces sp. NBC_01477]|uniref:CBM96 family carbohydrate-binding protein n=1 Tax=Streptomyces sp. NBC_01477 TaxID=2976015 RepID=UPI002E311271|nr:DNRLRE domain-containing protein [Streptomyces sp. NBC_01477]
MRRTGAGSVALGLAATSMVGFTSAGPAGALTAPVAMTADDLATWQTNGVVWALAQAGGVVFAGGTFSTVRPPGAAAGKSEHKALNFQAFDAASGAPTSCRLSFTVGTGTSTVRALAVSPDKSTLYAGGTFGSVNGTPVSNLAAIDIATCKVRTGFKVAVSAQVRAIAVTADTVYFGGNFTTVAGKARQHFAAVGTTGALKPFTAAADKAGKAVLVTPDGSKVVLGGDFTKVNGASSHALAVVNATTGANVRTYPGFIPPTSTVQSLASDATGFYTGNEGTGTGVFDGRIAVDFSTLNQRWRDTCLGATQAVQVYKGVLYSSSHAHDCSSMGQFPQMNDRQHLLAESVGNPRPLLGWFPDTDDGPAGTEKIGPRAMTVASEGGTDYLWVGGEFTRIASNGNRPQQGLVRFANTPDTRAPSVPQKVTATAVTGGVRVAWQAALDLDDSALTYTVYRDGTAVGTVAGTSVFWNRPTLALTDTTTRPGTAYAYQVTARDAAGNTTARSAAARVTTPGTPVSTTVTVTAGADSYANAAAPGATYGSDQQLAVRGSSAYTAYLRFTLPAAPAGTVLKSARLTVRTSADPLAPSADPLNVQHVTGGWTEAGVTWANRPALDPAAIGALPAPTAAQSDYSAPLALPSLSAALGRTYDLALTSASTDSAWFWSREAPGTAGHPQLALTFGKP